MFSSLVYQISFHPRIIFQGFCRSFWRIKLWPLSAILGSELNKLNCAWRQHLVWKPLKRDAREDLTLICSNSEIGNGIVNPCPSWFQLKRAPSQLFTVQAFVLTRYRTTPGVWFVFELIVVEHLWRVALWCVDGEQSIISFLRETDRQRRWLLLPW